MKNGGGGGGSFDGAKVGGTNVVEGAEKAEAEPDEEAVEVEAGKNDGGGPG